MTRHLTRVCQLQDAQEGFPSKHHIALLIPVLMQNLDGAMVFNCPGRNFGGSEADNSAFIAKNILKILTNNQGLARIEA